MKNNHQHVAPQHASIKTLSAIQTEVKNINRIALSVDCVIFGFDENKLKVLLIRSDLKKFQEKWSLLGDLVDPKEELDSAACRILKQRTGLGCTAISTSGKSCSVSWHFLGVKGTRLSTGTFPSFTIPILCFVILKAA